LFYGYQQMRVSLLIVLFSLGCGDNLKWMSFDNPADAAAFDRDPRELFVVAVAPASQAIVKPQDISVEVEFDRAVDLTTFTSSSFWAFGQWSGVHASSYEEGASDRSVKLSSEKAFIPGELVTVVVSHDVRSTMGAEPRSGGYSWQFRVGSSAASMQFTEIARLSTKNSSGAYGQAYGGVAADLNEDGWPDISVINEASEDVVVFMNKGDGSGAFNASVGEFELGVRPSPNEAADFNGDGQVDIVVANIGSGVTVLLGNGDGTFQELPEIAVDRTPRGVTTLDFDGDGDFDIVTANTHGSNLSPIRNLGNGSFEALDAIEGFGNGEWAISAADMDEDGLLDLVVGSRDDGAITVLTGDGAGRFNYRATRNVLPGLWMLNVGDLNGDGHADVTVAGGTADNGSILLGDGKGGLGEPVTYGTDPSTSATDIGDLDGDGDLDWVLSSFGGSNSDWSFWRNLGDGSFELITEWDSPEDASCAILVDLDLDGDLDMALLDEAEDLMILLENE
jgi:hypothetical protein